MVSALSFIYDDPGLNPGEAYNMKRSKINKKTPGLAHLKTILL